MHPPRLASPSCKSSTGVVNGSSSQISELACASRYLPNRPLHGVSCLASWQGVKAVLENFQVQLLLILPTAKQGNHGFLDGGFPDSCTCRNRLFIPSGVAESGGSFGYTIQAAKCSFSGLMDATLACHLGVHHQRHAHLLASLSTRSR